MGLDSGDDALAQHGIRRGCEGGLLSQRTHSNCNLLLNRKKKLTEPMRFPLMCNGAKNTRS